MKTFTIFLLLLPITLCAQSQLIDNKGNRNQSYPVITDTTTAIVQLIDQVDQDTIESYICYMQSFKREATSLAALIVQNWLVDNFETYGYDDISIHQFYIDSLLLDAGNVVVIKKGTEFPDEYIMISSHYDHSTFGTPCGPGADDNASGTAGVLECARLLKGIDTKRSIMFVPFNAEEYWLLGSMPFAQKCAIENMNIIAHFNMDMIGFFPPSIPNTIMASGYSYISKALFEYYHQIANIYVPSIPTIQFTSGDMYGGDHMPFNIYEHPSLYIGDTEYQNMHPCYHKECDTIGSDGGVNRLDLAKAFVQTVLSAAVELSNAWLPPQNLSACSGVGKINVSWDSVGDNTSYKVYRNNLLVKETTDHFYIDTDVDIGQKYEYYVIAFNNEQETAPSNIDKITFVQPLELPYFNNFSENKYGFEQSDWVLRSMDNRRTLSNTGGAGNFSDNYLSFAELNWFSIPQDIENISIRFKWQGNIQGIWLWVKEWYPEANFKDWSNAGLFFEVTNDRKTWHKLDYISGNNSWKDCEFSLNQFIGSDFFQARFRLESSGANNQIYPKRAFFTDFEIVFKSDTISVKEQPPYISSFSFSPNPANDYINIVTNQREPYHIAIYDMTGKVVFAQDGFNDGTLNVANLPRGSYLMVASTKQHRVARKLVVQ
jgi:hypothetical protein